MFLIHPYVKSDWVLKTVLDTSTHPDPIIICYLNLIIFTLSFIHFFVFVGTYFYTFLLLFNCVLLPCSPIICKYVYNVQYKVINHM